MAEQGNISIGIQIDPKDALMGLSKVQKALDGTGDAAGQMADDFTTSTKKTTTETKKLTDKQILEQERLRLALEETGEQAGRTGQALKKGTPGKNEIEGLETLKDQTGELDSSLKGLAGAVGVVSPEMEILLMRTGDLSGGLEAGSRMASLFGFSMGSLLRVFVPVTAALTGVFVAYKKLSGGVKEAEENLKKQHEQMIAGIAAAKAYEARMRQTRVAVGLLSDEEARLRDARDQATQGLDHQSERADKARQRLGVLRQALEMNTRAMNDARTANGSASITFVEVSEALEAAGRAAEGETGGFERASASAGSLRKDSTELAAAIVEIRNAFEAAEREVNRYDAAVKRDQAQILIGNAIRSGELDLMNESLAQLEHLTGAQRETVEAKLEAAILSAQAAAQAEREAEALERSASAREADTEATDEAGEARKRLAEMLATAQGDETRIQHEYEQQVEEINKLVELAGATEQEAAILTEAALARKREALEALIEVEDEYLTATKDRQLATVQIEKDAATAAQQARDERLADLFMALQDETITQEQFHAESLKAETEYQNRLKAIRMAKAQETIAQAKMVTDTLLGLTDANIDNINARLDAEEQQALKRAGDNMEAQEQIRETFEERRKSELQAAYKKRKNLEIANAIISGASASIAALAAPPTGLGPVLGAFMIPAIAAATGLQINAISQQNPSFHQGGIVGGMGDQTIRAQGGEVVLNRSTVAAMGGARAADSLNSGGAAGGSVVVQMTYKQRVFDQVVVDNLAKGGPLRNALNRASTRGRRGRIGGRL
jgi:hypothetical protein